VDHTARQLVRVENDSVRQMSGRSSSHRDPFAGKLSVTEVVGCHAEGRPCEVAPPADRQGKSTRTGSLTSFSRSRDFRDWLHHFEFRRPKFWDPPSSTITQGRLNALLPHVRILEEGLVGASSDVTTIHAQRPHRACYSLPFHGL
jgi:hypothetical protein